MTNWADLDDGYGDAAAVPDLIEALAAAPTPDLWSDLWGHLCHQGTVYSASFAAIPVLHQTCPRLLPVDRRGALMLGGAIMASSDRHGGAAPDEATLRLLPDLLRLTETAMNDPDIDEGEFPYLLQAALAFRGDGFWHSLLDGVASDEFQGWCHACKASLYILPENPGYSAVEHRRALRPDAFRSPVTPTSLDSLPRVGAWLHAQAKQHGRHKIADTLTYLYGKVACPECSASLSVAEAVMRSTLPTSTDEDD